MAAGPSVDGYAAKLEDPNLDLRNKGNIAVDLRDNLEMLCQGSAYKTFLDRLVPILLKLLDGPPVFISSSPEQRLRNTVLEILHRLPQTHDALEPYAPSIVDKLMTLVKIENEDNAVLCMKTIMDFERHQTKALTDRVQPFLDLIQEMFESMEQAVKDTFDNPGQASQTIPGTPGNTQYSQSPRPNSPVASTTELGGEQQQARLLLKGMQSFKVLAECPIIVVSLFQAYRNSVPRNVKLFIPLIKNVLMLQAKPQEKAHTDAAAKGEIFTGVCKEIKNRVAFGDFITAQVKTMSFLAYLLRVYSQQLTDFLPTLPDIVVRLLQDCPREKSGARKELLVAIRHIINFNFRKIFLKKIDELLDERTLIGDGVTVYETMRPLAYSMLADLIHHLRDSLSKEQIRKTVEVYTRNLHDTFPGTSFQTMSAKLLLNMAECIAKLEPKQDARYFLIMILNAIGDKFGAMNRQFDNAVKLSQQYNSPSLDAVPENYLAEESSPPDWDEIDIFNATPIKTSNPRERSSEPIADNKFLFKNLLHGLKNLFYQLRFCNPPKIKEEIDASSAPANWHEVSYGYNAEEVEVLIKLFREGALVFRYYGVGKQLNESQNLSPSELLANQHMMSSGKEEKELLEAFATVFHHIDPATFHEVFHSEIPHLYDMMFDHTPLLHVPQFLLASEATSPSFAGMLLQFLMGKIEEVGTADVAKSSILLRLFKLSFMAVTLFNTQNEQVLLPHVTKLIIKSIQLSTTAEEPMNHFLLLRSLFRSIGGGRFEHLYKEILPLLEMLLETLNNLLMAARKPADRDLFVELSLTVPARLSNLLPHLSYLMRPLVVALRAGSDLVGQGLRTLELCVDNLTADYLDPIMAPVIDELMTALWEHLKPHPYSHFHAHTTMRILGKLGGRNRKFLTKPPELQYEPYSDDAPSYNIRLIGTQKDRAFPSEIGLDVAIAKLAEIPKPSGKKYDDLAKLQSFNLIKAHTKLLLGFDHLPDDLAQLVRLQANDLYNGKHDEGEDLMKEQQREKSMTKKDSQQEVLRKLLKACIFANSIPELKEQALTFVDNLCRHFTLLEIGRALAQLKHNKKPFEVDSGEGPVCIDSQVICEAIGDSLSSENIEVREAAEHATKTLRDFAISVFGSKDRIERFPLFHYLAKTFSHLCHEEEWFVKAGGTLGIDILVNKLELSDSWIIDRQFDFVRSLLFVMKDMPQDLVANTRIQAQEIFEGLVRRCVKPASKDDIKNQQSKLFYLCGLLVAELGHMNRHVRAAAQRGFAIIAEVVGAEVHELIIPVKDRLILPIFNKPLRALPFAVQIAYIEAITYCLKLQHGVLEFNDPLTRLLMECLALADADDSVLTNKPAEYRNAESITNLRVACIRLLSTAQEFQEFKSTPTNQTFLRIIAVFFKALYADAPEVVDAANAGLKGVLSNNSKLPKDVLQSGLRPILVNLQDPRKLHKEGLDGLARLLRLLTNYFKVEIGSRLLDHMKTIADPASLQKTSFTLIEQNKQMKIVQAILNVFHLLPPAAITFLPQLVSKVTELEEALRRTHHSPFREPLIKYLNHYPEETWKHFAEKLRNHSYGRFFAQILTDPASAPLREVVTKDVPGFLAAFQIEDQDEKWPAIINAIHVARSITSFSATESWLVEHEDLRKELLEAAKALEAKLHDKDGSIDPSLRLAVEQAGEQAMAVFIIYMRHAPQDLDFFFDVVNAVTAEQLKALTPLMDFIYKQMISSDNVDYWKSLIVRCIDVYTGRNTAQKTKTFTFRNIVNPIIAMDVKRNWASLFDAGTKGTKLLDKSLVDAIHNKLWKPQAQSDASEETGQLGVDHSRMELLQLTTMLIKYHSNLVKDARKDIIKFGFNYIKLEDIINKHAAYVLIAYFIAVYDTPAKITLQIYTALLKAHQNEGRSLVMQALELLAPVLKTRLSAPGGGATGPGGIPPWARQPRRILTEDSSNLQQLMSIFNFLVRHPDLFYEAREQLSQIIIPSLHKIATPPSFSNENKKMALNLISLVRQWEERAMREAGIVPEQLNGSPSRKRKADGSMALDCVQRPFVAPAALRLMLVKYLIQFIIYLPERYPMPSSKKKETPPPPAAPPVQSTEAVKKAVGLLRDLLSPLYWGDLDIDNLLAKNIEQTINAEPKQDDKPEMHNTRIINTLQVLKVIVNVKPDDWVLSHTAQLQKLCEKPFRMENAEVQDCLHSEDDQEEGQPKLESMVKRILDVMPEPVMSEDADNEETPSTEFVNFCGTVATESLSNNNHISAINLLWTLCQKRPEEIDQQIPHLTKALNQKAKDHIQAQGLPGQPPQIPTGMRPDPNNQQQADPHEVEIQTGLILKLIDLLAARMSQLNDSRRPYLSVLASLVERSQNNAVCMKILDLVETWVFESTEPVPTLKEKTAVLTKMLMFEHRSDTSLLTRFLDFVIRIYEDPKITRSELTVRMEHAFLIGTRAQDVDMRNRFMTIFDKSLSRTASNRIFYVLAQQNWDTLGESYWLSQVIQLMFGSVEMGMTAALHEEDFTLMRASRFFDTYKDQKQRLSDVMVDDSLESLVAAQRQFCREISDVKVRDILEPLCHLQHLEPMLANDIWVAFFPLCWSATPKDERGELEKGIVGLLTKDYHMRQIDRRPNCVQTILEGVVKATPKLRFPPHVMKFLAKTYDAWYNAAVYLEENATHPMMNTANARESNLNALIELYVGLEESDLFYGTWRRRCQYVETNAALSYEQSGMWDKAQQMHEAAQIKVRTGGLPYSQDEYNLWEDHWVICAQKLQQWEILGEFAKHENFNDLYLESMYRNFDVWTAPESRDQLDQMIKSVSDAPTPRRLFWQAFMSLLKLHKAQEQPQDFHRICDEAIQLSIRKWHQLPSRITNAHIPLLQNFQQLVELHDASVVCNSLHQTTNMNLDAKSGELKLLLSTWRDRLPNFWDDINSWQDLVTWRQHIFNLINGTYLTLIGQQPNNAAGNSYAYRGYHETAWIINRFAHVARKHNLPEVCISQLSRIYTLPNIEIQEAFLKLREQAKCHYQNRAELNNGLDVINNTNLSYFGSQQKAEFYTLRGMFLAKLGNKAEANDAFGSALYFDIKLPKAWAEWGRYNDMLFKEDPSNLEKASAAISCYLEAASQYKNAKSRKLFGRILWLLGLDDANGTLKKAYTEFRGLAPPWYWCTYIPQLLIGLNRNEAPVCHMILKTVAKDFPQALYFQLRTTREDMHIIKKQAEVKDAKDKAVKARQSQEHSSPANKQGSPNSRPQTANGDTSQTNGEAKDATPKQEGKQENKDETNSTGTPSQNQPAKLMKPWEYVEDLMTTIKSSFPLLALSMETMSDQIAKNFKCPPDEDAYRLIVALLNDGLSYVGRQPALYAQDVKLPAQTEANITRFAESVLPPHIRKSFEADFVNKKPTMYEYIQKLRKWRNRFEERLDRRPSHMNLESYSHHLSEFRFLKFDDVLVPGQYLDHCDTHRDFVRIERFLPNVDLVRGVGFCHRRLKLRGHDGSMHSFALQHPAARSSRREERILQLFRIFNGILARRKESRRRNLQFHLPHMIPLAPAIRMVEDDASYVSLQMIWEDHCRRTNMDKDQPILFTMEKLRSLKPNNQDQATAIKLETFTAITETLVPKTIALDYFRSTYPSFDDFWLFRRSFTYNFAALTFMTYVMHMSTRYPHKLNMARGSGLVWGTELVPTMAGAKPVFHSPEPVPFRLTPNLQALMGPLALEGIFAPGITAIAKCLTSPSSSGPSSDNTTNTNGASGSSQPPGSAGGMTAENIDLETTDLQMTLSLFVRDELVHWFTQQHKIPPEGSALREAVERNCAVIAKRAISLAMPPQGGLPVNQTVIDFCAAATNPGKLANSDALWMGYL